MVINMDEVKLRAIAQLQEFLKPTPEVKFKATSGLDGDTHRYEHISRVLTRFSYRTLGKGGLQPQHAIGTG